MAIIQHTPVYEQLAVFLDDDPVPSAALEVLWDVEKYEVEDIMNTFIQKSLAMSEYDSHQVCRVYKRLNNLIIHNPYAYQYSGLMVYDVLFCLREKNQNSLKSFQIHLFRKFWIFLL